MEFVQGTVKTDQYRTVPSRMQEGRNEVLDRIEW